MKKAILALLATAGLSANVLGTETAAPVGRKIDEFTLRDFRGKTHALSDFDERQLVVVAFIGCECPLAKQYAPRLKKLADEYGPRGVA
ncbi:MAG: hypothetical protein B7Z73_09685, partial [Planctomycetia bacterium 21-64-5]